jgi:predicted XRE-type DNA-binding protein
MITAQKVALRLPMRWAVFAGVFENVVTQCLGLQVIAPIDRFRKLETSAKEGLVAYRTSCVFRPGADEKQTKVHLAVAMNQNIQNQRIPQVEAARRLSINQHKISALSNYRLDGFSVERLMNFLTALDRDMEIVIRRKPTSRKTARILVTAA